MTSPLGLAREMIELAKKATPEPWVWHTSNSWRRLRGGPRDEHSVAEPVIQHPDNHPDILATDADKAFIARSRSIAPALARDAIAMAEASAAAGKFCLTLEMIDNRCMATDGPVTPTLNEASAQELANLYEWACDIRAALSGKASADE